VFRIQVTNNSSALCRWRCEMEFNRTAFLSFRPRCLPASLPFACFRCNGHWPHTPTTIVAFRSITDIKRLTNSFLGNDRVGFCFIAGNVTTISPPYTRGFVCYSRSKRGPSSGNVFESRWVSSYPKFIVVFFSQSLDLSSEDSRFTFRQGQRLLHVRGVVVLLSPSLQTCIWNISVRKLAKVSFFVALVCLFIDVFEKCPVSNLVCITEYSGQEFWWF
jgi:hypothetical protein